MNQARMLQVSTIVLVATLSLIGIPALAGEEQAWPDHSGFDALLQQYVSEAGVDYAGWHASEASLQQLRDYLEMLAGVSISQMEEAPGGRSHALAYWLNLYNAVTLDLVLDGYPTKSIKDLGGMFSSPWKRDLVTVEGEALTLNAIENDIIRPRFHEPRIHFALNCAAVSCPPLRAGAYNGKDLEVQLEEQATTFLANQDYNYVDEKGQLRLSKIFDWYGGDFRESAGSIADYVKPYLPGFPPDKDDPKVKSNDYDWKLNDSSVDRKS